MQHVLSGHLICRSCYYQEKSSAIMCDSWPVLLSALYCCLTVITCATRVKTLLYYGLQRSFLSYIDVAHRLRPLSDSLRAAHVLYSSRADTQVLALQMRVVMLHTWLLK